MVGKGNRGWLINDGSQTVNQAFNDAGVDLGSLRKTAATNTRPSSESSPNDYSTPSNFFWMSKLQDQEMSAFITDWMDKDPAEFGASTEAFFDAFYLELQSQTWWIDHASNYRAAKEIELTDPGTWAEIIRVNEGDATKFAADLGVSLTDAQIEELALNMA